jgi:signal transduction histidine kinase
MGTWSPLDTLLSVAAVIAVAAAIYFYLQSRRGTESRPAVSLSSTPTVGQTEASLRAAELADRLRIIHEQQAIVTRALVQLLARSESAAFLSIKDRPALQRHSRLLSEGAKTALDDMRRAMDLAGQGFESVEDWPTLDSITHLFAEAEEQGLIVNLEEAGDRFALSPSAELALFRIITEAIDNARIHGGIGTEVDVLMTWGPHGLSIAINDDGERAATRRALKAGDEVPEGVTIESDQDALIEQNTGRGLLEMKSRAEAFDGIVHTQRVPGVGFTITASFPMLRYATDPKYTAESGS